MDAKKTVTDTGYIALGLGVLSIEQAGATARQISTRATHTVKPWQAKVGDQAADVRSKVSSVVGETRSRLGDRAKSGSERASALARDLVVRSDGFVDDVRGRIAPLVERLPRPAKQATAQWNELVDKGRSRVRDLVEVDSAAA